jgi:hypothetical protein
MNIRTILNHKFSAVMIVGLTAIIVVVLGFFFSLRTPAIDPRVTLEERQGFIVQRSSFNDPPPRIASVWDGEVMRTADRIGEATALALSTSLYAATEQSRGRTPRTVRDLVAGIVARNLLPPGLTLTPIGGVLASPRGTLSVRYRPAPLGIEVVAIGTKPEDGPALIARVPDETSKSGEAQLFVANSLAGVKVPAPFAPAAEVIALGWSPERWRSLK